MKIITQPMDLQPDCDPEDFDKACARCGHSEYEHELVAYWYEGACEADECTCTRFCLFDDEEED
jgi:hypothetical protein